MSRRLSDEELRIAEFRFEDPERSIADLNRKRPDAFADPIIIGYYSERPPGGRAVNPDAPYVWCCHCQRPTHWNGFVVRDSTGQTFIIGNECGRRHYGGSFDLVEKRFHEERARKVVLTQWARMAARVDDLERVVGNLVADPYLSLHDLKQRELQDASPGAFSRLRNAVGRGALELYEQVRDYEQEAQRADRFGKARAAFRALPARERKRLEQDGLAPEEDTTPIIISVSRNLGHVVGTSLLGLSDVREAEARVTACLREFRAADEQGTDAHDTRTLIRLRRNLVESADLLRQRLIATSLCQLFFEVDNLDRLTTWSAHFRHFRYSRREKDLHVWDEDRGETSILPIPDGDIPALQALEPFHITVVEDDLEEAGAVIPENQNDPLSPRYVA
jgi:hypothetical protein